MAKPRKPLKLPPVIYDYADPSDLAERLKEAWCAYNICCAENPLERCTKSYRPELAESIADFLRRALQDIAIDDRPSCTAAKRLSKCIVDDHAWSIAWYDGEIKKRLSNELKLNYVTNRISRTCQEKDLHKYCTPLNADSLGNLQNAFKSVTAYLISLINHERIEEILMPHSEDFKEIPQLVKLYKTVTKAILVLREIGEIKKFNHINKSYAITVENGDALKAYDTSYARFAKSFDCDEYNPRSCRFEFGCGYGRYIENWSSLNLKSLERKRQLKILKMIGYPLSSEDIKSELGRNYSYVSVTTDTDWLICCLQNIQEYALCYMIPKFGYFLIPGLIEMLKQCPEPKIVILCDWFETIGYGMYGKGKMGDLVEQQLGLKREEYDNERSWELLKELSRGKLTEREYWTKVIEEAGWPYTPEQMIALTDQVVKYPVPGTDGILQELHAKGYDLYLVSDLHEEIKDRIMATYPWITQMFKRCYWSFESGMLKSDPDLFETILRDIGCEPGLTFFIDDYIENINAASDLGIKGILFEDARQLRDKLTQAGLL